MCLSGAELEQVGHANRPLETLDPRLEQPQIRRIAEAELVEPLGLGAADVTRGRAAFRVRVFVMANERLPMRVAGALDRFAHLLSRQRHARATATAPTGSTGAPAKARSGARSRPRPESGSPPPER